MQDDPTKPIALPRGQADHTAAFVTDDSRPSAAYRSGTAHTSTSAKPASSDARDFDDEDADFQAALQASISDNSYHATSSWNPSHTPPPVRASSRPSTIPSRAPFRSRYDSGSNVPVLVDEDIEMIEDDAPVIPPQETRPDFDPVAASRARNQAFMERAMREQEMALRESRQVEAARLQAGYSTRRPNPRQEEEDEELRRAIEESRALHEGLNAPGSSSDHNEVQAVEELSRQNLSGPAVHSQDRVYDDDDAELQAALQASLADAPDGFALPDPPTPVRRQPSLPPVISPESQPKDEDDKETETETESEADTSILEEEKLSVEEMRRKRLARFGG